MSTRLSAELGKLKAARKRGGCPSSVTLFLVRLGSLTVTSSHGHWLRDKPYLFWKGRLAIIVWLWCAMRMHNRPIRLYANSIQPKLCIKRHTMFDVLKYANIDNKLWVELNQVLGVLKYVIKDEHAFILASVCYDWHTQSDTWKLSYMIVCAILVLEPELLGKLNRYKSRCLRLSPLDTIRCWLLVVWLPSYTSTRPKYALLRSLFYALLTREYFFTNRTHGWFMLKYLIKLTSLISVRPVCYTILIQLWF